MLHPALGMAAQIFSESGDSVRAGALTDELLAYLRDEPPTLFVSDALHALASTLSTLGRAPEFVTVVAERDTPWVRAALTHAAGNLQGSAEIYASMGALTDEAHDRLRLAEELIRQGRQAEADVALQRALAFYRRVNATRYIRQGEALLDAPLGERRAAGGE
jgi:hypothetical protein